MAWSVSRIPFFSFWRSTRFTLRDSYPCDKRAHPWPRRSCRRRNGDDHFVANTRTPNQKSHLSSPDFTEWRFAFLHRDSHLGFAVWVAAFSERPYLRRRGVPGVRCGSGDGRRDSQSGLRELSTPTLVLFHRFCFRHPRNVIGLPKSDGTWAVCRDCTSGLCHLATESGSSSFTRCRFAGLYTGIAHF